MNFMCNVTNTPDLSLPNHAHRGHHAHHHNNSDANRPTTSEREMPPHPSALVDRDDEAQRKQHVSVDHKGDVDQTETPAAAHQGHRNEHHHEHHQRAKNTHEEDAGRRSLDVAAVEDSNIAAHEKSGEDDAPASPAAPVSHIEQATVDDDNYQEQRDSREGEKKAEGVDTMAASDSGVSVEEQKLTAHLDADTRHSPWSSDT